MRTYIIKRILLIIPTFFAISLIVFLILNLAPGRPGGTMLGAEGTEAEDATGARREAYKIFKTQFNLDKPILFNTRFSLKTGTVEGYLRDILNEGESVPSGRIIRAQDTLEDLGQYSVPHLVKIIMDTRKQNLRDLAVRVLRANAQRNLVNPYAAKLSEKTKNLNREIDAENLYLKDLTYKTDTPEEQKLAVIEKWKKWYSEHEDRFRYSPWKKVSIFFFDTRFAKYWWNLLRLDLGVSHVDKKPVLQKILSKLKYSLSLSVTSILIAYIISIPLGILSAVKQNSPLDRSVAVVLFMLYAMPSFFVATVLLKFLSFGGYLHVFPTGGYQRQDYWQLSTLGQIGDIIWHLILPIACLTYASFASLSRYTRSGMLEVIRADYIRTARAKGLSEAVVIFKHGVRNGIIPVITLLATILPAIIGGSVIIEYIFGIPGMGLLTIDAIWNRDYNVIMGVELIAALLVLIGILLSDICYSLVDPRIKFE